MPRFHPSPLFALLICGLVSVSCRRASSLETASDDLGANTAPEEPVPISPAPANSQVQPTTTPHQPAPTPTPKPKPKIAGSGSSKDSPTISTSPGVKGGYVVLWPRVVPSSSAQAQRGDAQMVQSQLRALIERNFPGKAIDVRPDPQRSCPRAGCDGASVALMFARRDQGCVLLAVVTAAGPVDGHLVPWVGGMTLDQTEIPFRDPPESHATVHDYAACKDLVALMRKNEGAVVDAIRRVSP